MLTGGYSVNSAMYAFFNNGMCVRNEAHNMNTTLPEESSINVDFNHASNEAGLAGNDPGNTAGPAGYPTGSSTGNGAGSKTGNGPGVTRHAVYGDFNCLYPTSLMVNIIKYFSISMLFLDSDPDKPQSQPDRLQNQPARPQSQPARPQNQPTRPQRL